MALTYTEATAARRLELLTAARQKALAAAARLDQAAENARQALLTHDEGTPELVDALTRANREVLAARRDIDQATEALRVWGAVARRREDQAAIHTGEELDRILSELAHIQTQIDTLFET